MKGLVFCKSLQIMSSFLMCGTSRVVYRSLEEKKLLNLLGGLELAVMTGSFSAEMLESTREKIQ